MCGLFGFSDYKNHQSTSFLNTLCNSLARESEVRGNHATGISYINNGLVEIKKEAKAANKIDFKLPNNAAAVMGHTRFSTQGSEKNNRNNHPFLGKVNNNYFAFAHNGVIYNDNQLKRDLKLPHTKIETDSYIGVQLLESQKDLSLESHKYMAEQIQGSFTFTTLDKHNNLYITKGSSPISIINFKEIGLFIYASMEKILWSAMMNTGLFGYIKGKLNSGKAEAIEFIELKDGEIMKLSADGSISKCKFTMQEFELYMDWQDFRRPYGGWHHMAMADANEYLNWEAEYLADIIQTAASKGINEEDILMLWETGFDLGELEELIYDPEILKDCLVGAY